MDPNRFFEYFIIHTNSHFSLCSVYKDAAAVIISYDISSHVSFQGAVVDWLTEVREAGLNHPVI